MPQEFLDQLTGAGLLAIIRSSDPSAATRAALVLIESGSSRSRSSRPTRRGSSPRYLAGRRTAA
jgi:hypothetical protein